MTRRSQKTVWLPAFAAAIVMLTAFPAAGADAGLDRDLVKFGSDAPAGQTVPQPAPPPGAKQADLGILAELVPLESASTADAELVGDLVTGQRPNESFFPDRAATPEIGGMGDLVQVDSPPQIMDAPEISPQATAQPDSTATQGSGMGDLVQVDSPPQIMGAPEISQPALAQRDSAAAQENGMGVPIRVDSPPQIMGAPEISPPAMEQPDRAAPSPDNAADLRKLADLVHFDESTGGAGDLVATAPAEPEPLADLLPAENPGPEAGSPARLVAAAPPPALPELAPDRPVAAARPAEPAVAVAPLAPLAAIAPAVTTAASAADLKRAETAANLVKTQCDADELAKARETYESMPGFGGDPAINKFRADSANLLVLNYCREDNLQEARKVYDAMPAAIPGDGAMIGKARAIMNLVTFSIRSDEIEEGYRVFLDLEKIRNHAEVDRELFRLVSRMIPYLDNAGENEKAAEAYEYMLRQVRTPETIQLFCDSVPGLAKYLLAHPVVVAPNPAQERRLALMLRIFESLRELGDGKEIARLRLGAARAIEDYYIRAGNVEKAREMRGAVIAAGGKPSNK